MDTISHQPDRAQGWYLPYLFSMCLVIFPFFSTFVYLYNLSLKATCGK